MMSHANNLWHVVSNSEEQFSILRANAELPSGWRIVHSACTRSICLDYITSHWQNILPLSVRNLSTTPNTISPTRNKLRHLEIESLLSDIDHFESVVDEYPDRIAVVIGASSINYANLDRRCNQLANYLIERGLGSTSSVEVVCTHLAPCLDLVISMLAIAKTGAVLLALDPQLPHLRKQSMVNDCEPMFVIKSACDNWSPATGIAVVDMKLDADNIALSCEARINAKPVDGSLAYLFYTSGSTGKPNVVMMPRPSIASPSMSVPNPNESDRHVLKASPAFTLIHREIFQPLMTGGRLYILPLEESQSPDRLVDAIVKYRITLLSVVPAVLRAMLANPKLIQCSSLRFVDCVGEALPPELRKAFQRILPITIGVTYGCTEAPSTASQVFASDDSCEIVDIGMPLPDRQVYVLDENLSLLPTGIAGEIYIGGSLSIGYLGNPRLTAQRFLPDPFDDTSGVRMYATGDRGVITKNNTLQYLGREDTQIQINGQRVDTAEVEKAISMHHAVSQVVVITQVVVGSNCNTELRYLVAFVVPRTSDINKITLKHLCRAQLPVYMVPAKFISLKSLPLLPNGKTDHRALSQIASTVEFNTQRVDPRTSTERIIADIWSELLEVPQPGVDDNFLALGGNSILATQVASRVLDQLQVKLSMRSLFECSTIAELANVVDGKSPGNIGQVDSLGR